MGADIDVTPGGNQITSANTNRTQHDEIQLRQLVIAVSRRAPLDALTSLDRGTDDLVSAVLERLDPAMAMRIVSCLSVQRQEALAPLLHSQFGNQLGYNLGFSVDSVGRLMASVTQRFLPTTRVADAIEALRPLAQEQQLMYAYVVDEEDRLAGVVAMRELLFAISTDVLNDIMVTEPFYFVADSDQEDAMRAVLRRHYPMYPVCDDNRRLLGIVRGYAMFEQQTYELTA